MELNNYSTFKHEVYLELEALKHRLTSAQIKKLEGFTSSTIAETLYGRLYSNTAGTHAVKLYPKSFSDAMMDLNDKDCFKSGNSHTALEKLLNNANELSEEVYGYVSGANPLTQGIDSFFRTVEQTMNAVDRPVKHQTVASAKKMLNDAMDSEIQKVEAKKAEEKPKATKGVPVAKEIEFDLSLDDEEDDFVYTKPKIFSINL